MSLLLPVAIVVACAICYLVCVIGTRINEEAKKREKKPIKLPIKIPTEDGYLLVDSYVPTSSIVSIKQIHEKGKCSDRNRLWEMGLSDRTCVGCEVNKKTYAQTLYLPTYLPDTLSKLLEAIKELQERGFT